MSHCEEQMVNVYSNNVCYKYSVNEIDSICFGYNEKHTYYHIHKEGLEGWDEGCMDSNGCFLVCRQDSLDEGYSCFIGEKDREDVGIALKFDKDMNIQMIFSNHGLLNIFTDKQTNEIYGLFILPDSVYMKKLDGIVNVDSRNAMTRISAGQAIDKICYWVNNAQNINDIGKLFDNGSDYLPGFFIGLGLTSKIWGYSNPTSLGLSLLLAWLEKRYEENYNKILYDYMGAPMIWISNIDEKKAPSYKIEVSVNGLNTIGTPLTCSLHSGVAVKIDDSHVFYENCDMHLNDHTIKWDEVYNANLIAEKEKTYYLRPYVVVMIDGFTQFPFTRQRYLWGGPKDPLVTYGDVQELKINISSTTGGHSNVTDKSAVVECTYKGIPKGATCGVEYEAASGRLRQTTKSENGTHPIQLTGLEPNTTYTYRAYVLYDGVIYYAKNTETFTTNPPDISGTWTCTEEYYFGWDKNYQHPQYKSYPIVLKKDGTVSIDGKSDYVRSSWWYGSDGRLIIAVTDMSTSDFSGGFDINLKADDSKAPKKFTGAINDWSFNSTVGYVSRGGNGVVLTR